MKRFLKFFTRKLLVTHIYGIPVKIDYRWFLVLGLLSWFVAQTIPNSLIGSFFGKFSLGLITVLVFFFSIFLHELAHAYVARRERIQVLEILLHPFGGLSKLRREPDTPGAEFRIAIAGPIASFFISLVFLAFWAVSNSLGTVILSPLFFALFLLNLLLAVFNLFPGYPLDGGRVLRAFLWRRGKDLNEATVLTGKFGQYIAATLIVFGIVVISISRDTFTGIWSILVGVFLFDSAAKIIRQINNFENLIVEQVMEMPVSIEPDETVMHFVDHILPLYKYVIFPVASKKQLYGFLVLDDIKRDLPREKWTSTTVKDVMRVIREDYFIEADALVTNAVALMQVNGLGVLGVIDPKAELVGFIQRGRIRRRS